MSFEDFLAEFKKRHAKDYGLSNVSVAAKAHMPKVEVKATEKPVSVPKAVVLEDEWEPPELVEVDEPEEWWNK